MDLLHKFSKQYNCQPIFNTKKYQVMDFFKCSNGKTVNFQQCSLGKDLFPGWRVGKIKQPTHGQTHKSQNDQKKQQSKGINNYQREILYLLLYTFIFPIIKLNLVLDFNKQLMFANNKNFCLLIFTVASVCILTQAIITEYSQAQKQQNYLTTDELCKYLTDKVLIIDVRDVANLESGIIQGVLNMNFQDKIFISQAGKLLKKDKSIILYGDKNNTLNAVKQLLSNGYTNVIGIATFPMQQWIEKSLPYYMPEFVHTVQHDDRSVLDVRMDHQWASGVADVKDVVTYTLEDAFHQPLNLDINKKYVVHCRGGYRARMAYSWLKGHGYDIVLYNYQIQKIGKLKPFQRKNNDL